MTDTENLTNYTTAGATRLPGVLGTAHRAVLHDPLLKGAPAELIAAGKAFDRGRRGLLSSATAGRHSSAVQDLAGRVVEAWTAGKDAPATLRSDAGAAEAAEQAAGAELRVLAAAAGTVRDTLVDLLRTRAGDVIRGPLQAEATRIAAELKAATEAAGGRDFLEPEEFVDAEQVARDAFHRARAIGTQYTRLREAHRLWLAVESDDGGTLPLHLEAHRDESPYPLGTAWPADPFARFLRFAPAAWCPSLADLEAHSPTYPHSMIAAG